MKKTKTTILRKGAIPKQVGCYKVIVQAQAVYAVFYDGMPINSYIENTIEGTKNYTRTSYATAHSALATASRLNREFGTDLFEAVALMNHIPIRRVK